MIRNKVLNTTVYFRDKENYPNSADFTLQLENYIKMVTLIRRNRVGFIYLERQVSKVCCICLSFKRI